MRQPVFLFYAALILAILYAGWHTSQRPAPAPISSPPVPAPTHTPAGPSTASARTLEMVFALDTTGSMGGLIDGAKRKIWGIVNGVLKSQTAHRVRVGLVAYRDRGDDYVTKVVRLSDDLDSVYAELMDFQASGGGDTPEDVRQALLAAVRDAGWSRKSKGVSQILFLVGDSPPHDDYQDEPRTQDIVAEAAQRGLLIDAIQCGDSPETRQQWQMIASRGQGEYFAIAQDGGVQSIDTPYDRELADLGRRMSRTYVPYGKEAGGMAGEERMRAQGRMEAVVASSAPVSARAERAVNKAINESAYRDDLVAKIADGRVKAGDYDTGCLPATLAALPPAEQVKEIQQKVDERKALSARITEIAGRRDSFLKAQAPSRAGASFDAAVAGAIARQVDAGGRSRR